MAERSREPEGRGRARVGGARARRLRGRRPSTLLPPTREQAPRTRGRQAGHVVGVADLEEEGGAWAGAQRGTPPPPSPPPRPPHQRPALLERPRLALGPQLDGAVPGPGGEAAVGEDGQGADLERGGTEGGWARVRWGRRRCALPTPTARPVSHAHPRCAHAARRAGGARRAPPSIGATRERAGSMRARARRGRGSRPRATEAGTGAAGEWRRRAPPFAHPPRPALLHRPRPPNARAADRVAPPPPQPGRARPPRPPACAAMATAVTDLTPVLASAQSPDAATRHAAEAALEAARAANPPAFLLALAAQLAGEDKPAATRQIAGLILKNALDAPSDAKKVRKRGGAHPARIARRGRRAPRLAAAPPHPASHPPIHRLNWRRSGRRWMRASRPRSGARC